MIIISVENHVQNVIKKSRAEQVRPSFVKKNITVTFLDDVNITSKLHRGILTIEV